jgi:hypothetical protein
MPVADDERAATAAGVAALVRPYLESLMERHGA